MTDISPEAVKAFVEGIKERTFGSLVQDGPRNLIVTLNKSLDMLTALLAKCESLAELQQITLCNMERLAAAAQARLEERDALKAKLARLVEAAEEIDKWRMQSIEMMPPEIRGSWMRFHAAIAAARETL